MKTRNKHLLTDGLEFLIIFAMIFLLVTIYVPQAIWAEEKAFEEMSHFRMENIFEIEDFYHQLRDEFSEDALWAMNVVNAIRDSLTADSTFLNEQILYLDDQVVNVTVPLGWDINYDTTFGFRSKRKELIEYTQYVVVTFSASRNAYDTSYVVLKDLAAIKEDPSFVGIIAENLEERVEIITYYDTYMPDSSFFYCPLTNESYEISIENGIKVSSPIKEEIIERQYLVFSFRGANHGYIEDGVPSWKM